MEDTLAYNIGGLLSQAIMLEEPLLVVEGIDDVDFYKRIADKKLNVKCSELVQNNQGENYCEGCEGVISVVTDVQMQLDSNPLLKNYFLGIIDADYRVFMNMVDTQLQCLFILKYYSYESHFLTNDSIKNYVSGITRVRADEVTDEVMDILMDGIEQIKYELYYAGLESLKGRLVSEYNSIVSYDKGVEALYQITNDNSSIIDKVLEKKRELDEYAEGIEVDLSMYRRIARGKWIIYAVAKCIYINVSKVKEKCGDAIITQCDFCRQAKFNKCVWSKSNELSRKNYVHQMIFSNLNEPELQYIKDKLNMLGING